jgi:hypothetical protein
MSYPARRQNASNPNYHVHPKHHASPSHRVSLIRHGSPTRHASPSLSRGRPLPFPMVATTIGKESGGCHNHLKRRARGEAAR